MDHPIGEFFCREEPIEINAGRESVELIVTNTGDRPIQIGSHYHFAEANFALVFDREKAFGRHLDVISGSAVRFEPGEEKEVSLVEYAGAQLLKGFNGLTMGRVHADYVREQAFKNIHEMEAKNPFSQKFNKK